MPALFGSFELLLICLFVHSYHICLPFLCFTMNVASCKLKVARGCLSQVATIHPATNFSQPALTQNTYHEFEGIRVGNVMECEYLHNYCTVLNETVGHL